MTLYRLAILCGAIPLVAGVCIFVLRIAADLSWLEPVLSIYFIVATILVAGGIVSYSLNSKNAKKSGGRVYRKQGGLPIVLLLLNIPIILLTYVVGDFFQSSISITIANDSRHDVTKVFLRNGKDNYFYKNISPDEKVTRAIRFQSNEAVNYSFSVNNKKLKGVVFKEVNKDIAKDVVITITKTNRVSIKK